MLSKIRWHECPASFTGRGESALTNGLVLIGDVSVCDSSNVEQRKQELVLDSTSVMAPGPGTGESVPGADSRSLSLLHVR
jgi:hypothetical protein